MANGMLNFPENIILKGDIIYVPPPGWTVDSGPTLITVGNQEEHKQKLAASCSVKAWAAPRADGFSLPPIGWYVVYLSRAAGASFDALKAKDTVWVSASGEAISLADCTSTGGGVLFGSGKPEPKPASVSWLGLGIAAGLLYLLTR